MKANITNVNYYERIAQATYADALAYCIATEQLIHCVDFLGGCSVDHPAVELLEQRFEKLLDDKAAERAAKAAERKAKRKAAERKARRDFIANLAAENAARKVSCAIAAKRATKAAARRAKRAIAKYGEEACKEANRLHVIGYGASGVSHAIWELKGNTRAADAAINAGRWLAVYSDYNI